MPASTFPAYEIKLDGADLSDQAQQDLLSITVTDDVDAAGSFHLEFSNWDPKRRKVTWSDSDTFKLGTTVEISMGYDDGQLETMIMGEITGMEASFDSGGFTMTVQGYDMRHRMMRVERTRVFSKQTDSDIAATIARDAKLTAQAKDTAIQREYVLQYHKSDWDFLTERAKLLGYELRVAGKKLFFEPAVAGEDQVIELSLETDLLSFQPRLSTMAQKTKVQTRAWDAKEAKAIIGSASRATAQVSGGQSGSQASQQAFGEAEHIQVGAFMLSKSEADQVAAGQFDLMSLSLVKATGTCLGRTDLRAGARINIGGLGQRFSGEYLLTSTTHTIKPEGRYTTSIEARRNTV